jgi:predicted metal-dependent phosphoesterase TrpH
MCIDLHTHSVYSDGTATPAELVKMAVSYGLTGFSLTDHDTTEGIREAVGLGKEQGLQVISGLEIGAIHRGRSLHILGYGFAPEHPGLLNRLEQLQQGRRERNSKILNKLAAMGINISKKELTTLSQCGQAGRPHIARILIDRGYARTMNEAFKIYLGRNKPAWQSRFAYTAGESIDMIHQAGGIAVLAHPGQLDTSMRMQPQIIKELVERKLDGLEIFYPSHSRKMKKKLHEAAKQYNLLVTGGSDYHGNNRAGGMAGSPNAICPPDTIMDELWQRLRRQHEDP